MTDPREVPPVEADGPSSLVADLEATATRQVERARQGDLREAQELGARAETLLRGLRAVRSEDLRPYADRLARIQRLQHHLELILGQQRQESAARRTQLSRGKVALRAYRGR